VTLVYFYIGASDSDDARLKIVCRIADKANDANQHVFIHGCSDIEAKKLDELLWTLSQGSFIPHKIVREGADAAPAEPVIIGLNRGPLSERWDLMINLASDVPEFFSRYRRVAEVVDGDATRRAQSRDRYRFYRDRGYTLNTHQV
jgi:DNA polymerase-3 subunit chi